MFDINGGEMLVLLVVAVIVIGPERLPSYAEQLARLVKRARAFVASTRERVDDELGAELGDVDWTKLDPRRYDPRRIVRDALIDEDTRGAIAGAFAPLGGAGQAGGARSAAGGAAALSATTAGTAAGTAVGTTAAVAGVVVPDAWAGVVHRRSGTPVPFDDEAT